MGVGQRITVEEQKLLERVVGYYQHSLITKHDLLETYSINKKQTVESLALGFADGTLKDILPDDPAVIKLLKKLNVLDKKGKEQLSKHLILPLHDSQGSIVNICGLNGTKEPLFLINNSQGLFNRHLVKRTSTAILTSSFIDSIVLFDQGFTNTLPIIGLSKMPKEYVELLSGKIKDAYLLLTEKSSEQAALVEQLGSINIATHEVNLPAKSCELYFHRHTPEEFEQLLQSSNPSSIEQSDALNKRKQSYYTHEENGFTVGYGKRYYQVKGIQRLDTQLKVTIKVSEDVNSSKPFELTTIDLYSSRSRHWFAKLCANLFNEPEALLKDDISKVLILVEEWKKPKHEQNVALTASDEKLAVSYLKKDNLFEELLKDFEILGVTGEETNKLVGYLAATSRKLDNPLSVLIQSRSAAGKSTLQDCILSLIPDDEITKYSRLTAQALFYKAEDSLQHKILAIEEAEGMGSAAYSIRNMQSAKKITVATTGKDSTGRMRTDEYTVQGPVCVMITTTATEIDQETASRFITLTIDESSSMTESIHNMQREAETLEGLVKSKQKEQVIKKHHAIQRMLQPIAVINPFAQYLSYPSNSLQARRDHQKYLGLIRAVAYMNQYKKEKKSVEVDGEHLEYIEVCLSDIEIANELATVVLGGSMDELAQPSKTLLTHIHKMVEKFAIEDRKSLDKITFTRRLIREFTGWSDWQVKSHIKQLEEFEYLVARVGSKGKEYRYILNYNGQPESDELAGFNKCYLNLTPVEEIQKHLEG